VFGEVYILVERGIRKVVYKVSYVGRGKNKPWISREKHSWFLSKGGMFKTRSKPIEVERCQTHRSGGWREKEEEETGRSGAPQHHFSGDGDGT